MIKFILYLIESGICLTILFLTYIFFFRKETYFNFNRWYLISSIAISLVLPIIHIQITIDKSAPFAMQLSEMGKYKSYYEKIIAMADPDYYQTSSELPAKAEFENPEILLPDNQKYRNTEIVNHQISGVIKKTQNITHKSQNTNLIVIVIFIYTLGVIFFLFRLGYLIRWLNRIIRNNDIQVLQNIRIINLKENMPPFSFFRFVFINNNELKRNEYEQIIAHEKVHSGQYHSLDLLFAHFISILQWFNPVVWLLQKAIKTNHEYIADRIVIQKGYELLDYQSLLLSQLIGIRSVELVNNLNLVSIKKRITMMNRIKSGIPAKLKALLIIPAALIVFIFLADTTVTGTSTSLEDVILMKSNQALKKLEGVWENKQSDSYGKMIRFNDGKMEVLENKNGHKSYNISASDTHIKVKNRSLGEINLSYELSGNELTVWWNETDKSKFTKTPYQNSFEAYISKNCPGLQPVNISHFRLLERSELCIEVLAKKETIII